MVAMTEQLLPPANWYADPEGSGRWRYWDGAAWTGVYLNQPQPGPSVLQQYWGQVRWLVFGVCLIGVLAAAFNASDALPIAFVLASVSMQDGEHESPVAARIALFA